MKSSKNVEILYRRLDSEEEINVDTEYVDDSFEEETGLLYGYLRRKSRRWITTVGIVMAIIIVTFTVGIVIWQTTEPDSGGAPEFPEIIGYGEFQNAAVSCDAPVCSEIGKSMLLRNGSVADAAIAALLCMGVIHSQSMGVGGGFLMVMYKSAEKRAYTLNARETAPSAAYEDMFDGDPQKAQTGGLAVGIPGEIRGYWKLHQEAGLLPWKDLFAPSIKLCKEGFLVTRHTANAFLSSRSAIMNSSSLQEIFVNKATGDVYKQNDRIYRTKLGETFEKIAEKGGDEFYEGEVGRMLIEDLTRLGGIMTAEDLRNYRPEWSNTSLEVELRGNYKLHVVPPPGSGLLMAFMMKILDYYSFNPSSLATEAESVRTYQRITEAFKHAFAKRTSLGDPFDTEVEPEVRALIKNLTSDAYVDDIRMKIFDDSTNNTHEYYGAEFVQPDDHGTAHVSVIGANGDAIAITSTVNLYFGAKIRSVQTGVIFNDEMDDFSAPNITNYFGVPPSPNNFIKPGKRPLSSMTPAIITDKEGKVRLAIGTAGGTKITTATTYAAIRNLWFEENLKTSIDAPRIHHQLYPMELQVEKGFPSAYIKALSSFGHKIDQVNMASSVTCGVARYPNGTIFADSDYRKGGSVAGY